MVAPPAATKTVAAVGDTVVVTSTPLGFCVAAPMTLTMLYGAAVEAVGHPQLEYSVTQTTIGAGVTVTTFACRFSITGAGARRLRRESGDA